VRKASLERVADLEAELADLRTAKEAVEQVPPPRRKRPL
jgi:hypothetical protein